MLEHPGVELQLLIREKGLTQKAFSSILGKKVSEVNELLKGKRNITIQWDYLLHQTLGTPIKYWILKQIDYDYSLLDIDKTENSDVILNDSLSSGAGGKSTKDGKSYKSSLRGKDLGEVGSQTDSSSEGQSEQQETPIQELNPKNNEDLKNRAKIFRTF